MEYFAKARSLALSNKNIQSDFKATDIYPPIDHSKMLDKFPLHEFINAISQNNITECSTISKTKNITFAYNLRDKNELL